MSLATPWPNRAGGCSRAGEDDHRDAGTITSITPAATLAVTGVCASTSPSIEIGIGGRVSTFNALPEKLIVS